MNIVGKTLAEVSPALYEETVSALQRRAFSAAGASLDEALAKRVAESLANATISRMCECGQDDCRSYYFDAPANAQGAAEYLRVRFHARGEHMLDVDEDGNVYHVERLYDLGGVSTTRYERRRDGSWAAVELPN